MKIKLIITGCLVCCFIFSIPQIVAAQSEQEKTSSRPVILKTLPELNESSPLKKRHSKKSLFLMMTASGGIEAAYNAEFKGIKFQIAVDSATDKISFISTTDEVFKTAEGVMVGDTLEKILEISKGEVIKERGWAFYVRFNSGWNAAFMQGEELTEGELSPRRKSYFFI